MTKVTHKKALSYREIICFTLINVTHKLIGCAEQQLTLQEL